MHGGVGGGGGGGGVDKICFMEKEEKEHVLSISDGFKCS